MVLITRKGDRIIEIKLVINTDIINIVCAYAPLVNLSLKEHTKPQFWDQANALIREVPRGKKYTL